MSLGRSVEAGTWLIAREVRRRSDVARPSPLARICVCRPDTRQSGGVNALIATTATAWRLCGPSAETRARDSATTGIDFRTR